MPHAMRVIVYPIARNTHITCPPTCKPCHIYYSLNTLNTPDNQCTRTASRKCEYNNTENESLLRRLRN